MKELIKSGFGILIIIVLICYSAAISSEHDHKWRTWWAYAMVCEAPDCPELNPPTMRLRLEWGVSGAGSCGCRNTGGRWDGR